MDGEVDLERIAKVIVAAKPDVVALQAVDEKANRSGGVDQTAELGRLTGLKGMFSRAIDNDGGGYGNSVLTNLPVRSQETVMLKLYTDSQPELAEQRAVQVVELGGKDAAELLILCTSLDYRQGSVERMKSALTINELIKKRGNTPAILAGTLNIGPGHEALRELAKEWKIAGVNQEGMRIAAVGEGDNRKFRDLRTYPSIEPRYGVNSVMCRPAASWSIEDLRVINEPVASNHRPMLVILRRAEKKDEAGSKK
jgi:endonuclease/exonuclease/phosphatase family metal-dependent hydrolase